MGRSVLPGWRRIRVHILRGPAVDSEKEEVLDAEPALVYGVLLPDIYLRLVRAAGECEGYSEQERIVHE